MGRRAPAGCGDGIGSGAGVGPRVGVGAGVGYGACGTYARAVSARGVGDAILVVGARDGAACAGVGRRALKVSRGGLGDAPHSRAAVGVGRARASADAAAGWEIVAPRVVSGASACTWNARAWRAHDAARAHSLTARRDASERRRAGGASLVAARSSGARVKRADAGAIVALQRSPDETRRMRRVHRRARICGVSEAERVAHLMEDDAAHVDEAIGGIGAERPAVVDAVEVDVGVVDVALRVEGHDRLAEGTREEVLWPRVLVEEDAVHAVVAGGERGGRRRDGRAERRARHFTPAPRGDRQLGERVLLPEIARKRRRKRKEHRQGARGPSPRRHPARVRRRRPACRRLRLRVRRLDHARDRGVERRKRGHPRI